MIGVKMEGETQEARDNREKICAQNIPDELVFDILTRLPVKSVLRFKCIRKSWLSMISHPKFIKTHLHLSTKRLLLSTKRFSPSFSSIDFESANQDSQSLHCPWDSSPDSYFRILCSCDGLILLSFREELFDKTKPGFLLFREEEETSVAVYSLRNNSWNIFIDNRYFLRWSEHQAVVNGVVHWVMYSIESSLGVIVYFDLAEGKFKEVPPPSSLNEYDGKDLVVMVLGGFLCVYCAGRVKQIEVYVMKEYGKKESWARLFVLPCAIIGRRFSGFNVKLLCLTKKGQVLISAGVMGIGTAGEMGIGIYNPKDGTFLLYDSIRGYMPIPYVESLVSLNAEV